MNIYSSTANSQARFARSFPKKWIGTPWILFPHFFAQWARRSKVLVPAFSQTNLSLIVTMSFGILFTTLPLGIYGRPDVRLSLTAKRLIHISLHLLRSLMSGDLQSTKFWTSITGTDGGRLGQSLTSLTKNPFSLMFNGINPCSPPERSPWSPTKGFHLSIKKETLFRL